MAKGKAVDVQPVQVAQFTKEQLLKSQTYQERRDLVNALLDDSKKYTKEQVDTMIGEYLKGQVK